MDTIRPQSHSESQQQYETLTSSNISFTPHTDRQHHLQTSIQYVFKTKPWNVQCYPTLKNTGVSVIYTCIWMESSERRSYGSQRRPVPPPHYSALPKTSILSLSPFICIELLLLYLYQLSLSTPVTLNQVDSLSDPHRRIMCEHLI